MPEPQADDKHPPAHIAIIMDGNGRWAASRNRPRTQGHLEGLTTAKKIVKAVSDRGVQYLTLYVFSTENWKRSASEVGFIMGLVKQHLKRELDFYRENHIRTRHIGDSAGLPPDVAQDLRDVCEETKHFDGLQVILALNYGGRGEITRAVQRLAQTIAARPDAAQTNAAITEQSIRDHLDNPDVPDPDLVIRTGGDLRSSNFLVWQSAYSEFYFSDKLWPDWTEADLDLAIAAYQQRDRRFGGVKQPSGRP
ncbi:MAG: di-trans,poly-cis-decaprenylcistransferase [Treponema sp.]|jgi:undecaprenyl diphosphate synthase|nr:di-trans,poly-cis-decaprenylcistransferase [Treponema sp.]